MNVVNSSVVIFSQNDETDPFYYFNKYWYDLQDHRSAHIPFINRSPWGIIALLSIYLLLIKKLIPNYMKNRKAFNLRGPMFAYNVLLIAVNSFFFFRVITIPGIIYRIGDFRYPPPEDSSDTAKEIVHLAYLYSLSKWLDLVDTFFMAFRKKSSHLTFLHLYHHSMVPILAFLHLKINPLVPAGFVFCLLNTLVHTVMYSYYALSSFGPEIQRFLWWKKYITILQLGQFVVFGVYALFLFTFQTGYPRFWMYFGCTQPPIFFYLFYDFYQKAYSKENKLKKR